MLNLQDRFESHLIRSDGCWLWTSEIDKDGYGKFRVGDRKCFAHRVAWELYCGHIPEGLCVLHKCDNPPCVNPAHLFLGTHADNMRDMFTKGRAKQKLTDGQVREVRELYATGKYTYPELAHKFGVVYWYVCRIVRGKVRNVS